ncbi:MAG: arginine deiminase [Spirochaetaceae bacterium]|nr:arginine deiminase [Spirochaetaceae bacterium]
MTGVNVKSEIKPLKKVLLHRPGRELLNLTPDSLAELLFDDIPFLKIAQVEHDAFAKILKENGVEVVYIEDLAAEVLDKHPDLRKQFLEQFILEARIYTDYYQKFIYDYLNSNYKDNKELILKTMEGVNLSELNTNKSVSLVDLVSDASKMVIAPIPNLYFTRDPFAMIGNGVSINKMFSVTRCRETIYGEYIFKYHPDFNTVPQYYSRYNHFHIEGGDILNLTEKIIAIGISQRTEPDAIEQIANNIFNSKSPVDTILAFNIPNSRAFMHLDTVFTQIDYDKFTVHPGILGTLAVFEITSDGKGGIHIKEIDDELEHILSAYLGNDVELIPCADKDRIAAEREQWTDASNTLCLSPGTVVVYDRNEITNAVLRHRGVNVLEMPSSELSRGRGGPRCMSMPVWRED